MTVVPLPARGEWYRDAREGAGEAGRALRVSWHTERGFLVVSTWRDGTCTGTVRLDPGDAARLVGLLAQGLAELAVADESGTPTAVGG